MVEELKSHKIIVAAGGSGGHLFPAVGLAEDLRGRHSGVDLVFCGGGLAKSAYFSRENFVFEDVSCSGLSGPSPWKLALAGGRIARGVMQSIAALRRHKPKLVVGFGSFHSFPVLVAARLLGIPLVLHEANAIPGRVVRMFAPGAKNTGYYFDAAASRLQGLNRKVAMPRRQTALPTCATREEALTSFGLDPQLSTLLVFGGSQGAQAINALLLDAVPLLSRLTNGQFQVMHFTGNMEYTQRLRDGYSAAGVPCYVRDFEVRIGDAWLAADCAFTRSGACTVSEMVLTQTPGLLVPYPYAMDRHQDANADALVSVGAAWKRMQSELNPEVVAGLLAKLLNDEHGQRRAMKTALVQLVSQEPQETLAELVLELLRDGTDEN